MMLVLPLKLTSAATKSSLTAYSVMWNTRQVSMAYRVVTISNSSREGSTKAHLQRTISNQSKTIIATSQQMHGVGAQMVEDLPPRSVSNKVFSVAEQKRAYGTASWACELPNPVIVGKWIQVNLAKSVGGDIACANDPDADRFAAAKNRWRS